MSKELYGEVSRIRTDLSGDVSKTRRSLAVLETYVNPGGKKMSDKWKDCLFNICANFTLIFSLLFVFLSSVLIIEEKYKFSTFLPFIGGIDITNVLAILMVIVVFCLSVNAGDLSEIYGDVSGIHGNASKIREQKMTGKHEIAEVLEERGKRYGGWREHAECAIQIKRAISYYSPCRILLPYQRESLDMIAHKMARIICGDPNYVDSWLDIAGYAQLVVNELRRRQEMEK